MAFWNFQTLVRRAKEEEIILPYSDVQAQGCSYELKLGDEVCITSDDTKKTKLEEKETIKIPSGQFALLITEEIVAMPKDTLAFISIKFGIKAQGLINVSGFHVDPGFKGRLKFSVYNAGAQNIILSRGDVVFMIWFCNLTENTEDVYNGVHNGQMHITTSDVQRLQGEIASPGQLRKKLGDIELSHRYNKWLQTLLIGLGVGIVITLASNYFKKPSDHVIFYIKEKVKMELRQEGWRETPLAQSESLKNSAKSKPSALKGTSNDSK